MPSRAEDEGFTWQVGVWDCMAQPYEREIDWPFLDLPLPAADGRRVAILLHPGRVKSGLQANLRRGRALRRGAKVTLVIRHPELGPMSIASLAGQVGPHTEEHAGQIRDIARGL